MDSESIKEIAFGTHNVELSEHNRTKGQKKILLADSQMMAAIRRTIDTFIAEKEEDRKQLKLIDLGCMEGGYAVEFAKMGFDTTGLDARKENLLKANIINFSLKLPNLKFILDDARNLANYGQFDVVFCTGLLYHIDNPDEFLKTIAHQTNRILILNTFYAPDKSLKYAFEYRMSRIFKDFVKKKQKRFLENEAQKPKHLGYIQHIKNYRLEGKISLLNGYKGRWFREWGEEQPQNDIEKMPGAAYNNHRSFWFCKPDLIKALFDAGFKSVYEQYDDIGDLRNENPDRYYPRTMLVAVK